MGSISHGASPPTPPTIKDNGMALTRAASYIAQVAIPSQASRTNVRFHNNDYTTGVK